MDQAFRTTFILGSPPEYEPGPERSLAGIAAATGRTPLAVAYDAMLEDDGRGLLYVPILNYSDGDLEPAREMLLHPRAAAGLGDGGAHCGVICDASQPTFMLTHWTRDRITGRAAPARVDGEEADPRHRPALRPRRPGHHRGRVPWPTSTSSTTTTCSWATRRWSTTCRPAAAACCRGPSGYVETIKSGVTTFADGKDTGARPGTLLRGAR